uniref:Uncharacterized protein n=1 Tax=Rhizophora mucronata TaxID=61149 RepID=A0A2P2QJB3_RHIMU
MFVPDLLGMHWPALTNRSEFFRGVGHRRLTKQTTQ